MKVILLDKISKLGEIGDVVNVKSGFARNFLIPQKKALFASKDVDLEIDKSQVQLPDGPLKELGEHKISIAMHPEVSTEIIVKVIPE